jgi:hypothetical protein
MPAPTQNMRAAAVRFVTFAAVPIGPLPDPRGHASGARCSAAFAPQALAQTTSSRQQPLARASHRLLGPDHDEFLARVGPCLEQLPVRVRELSDDSRTSALSN